MQTIKWSTRALNNQLSDKSLTKPSFFSKYSPSREKNPLKKSSKFLQKERSKGQLHSGQKDYDISQNSILQNNLPDTSSVKKVKPCISSGKKIKAKFPIRQMQGYNNKEQFKTFIRSILKQIKNIVHNLRLVFYDVDYMLKDLQKTFNFEVSKMMDKKNPATFKALKDFSIRKTESINMNQKNETIRSFPHIEYHTQLKTQKKQPYNSQITNIQIQNTLPRKIKNSYMNTETTEISSKTNLFKTKKDSQQINRGCKSNRNCKLVKQQNNSPDSRKSSISVQMSKIKGALGQMKNMLSKK